MLILKDVFEELIDSILKRRLLCGICCYIVGMLFIKSNLYLAAAVCLIILFFLIVLTIVYLKKKYILESCIYMVIFFVIGTVIMFIAKNDSTFNNFSAKDKLQIQGVITEREYTSQSIRYTLFVKSLYHQVSFYTPKEEHYDIGDLVKVSGVKKDFDYPRNEGQFNEINYYKSRNIDFIIDSPVVEIIKSNSFSIGEALRSLREIISDKIDLYINENSGLLKGILLGDKSSIDSYEKELYQRSGISHILAISGLHVTNISMVIFFVFNKLKLPKLLVHGCVSFVLIIYGLFSGFSSSVVRAVVMYIIAGVASHKGLKNDTLTAMAVSFFTYTLIYPYSAFSAGTILSYLAIFSIWVYSITYKKIHLYKSNNKVRNLLMNKVYKPLSLGLFLTMFSFPIVVYCFYTIPIFSVFINLYVVAMMPALFILGLIGIFFTFLCPAISGVILKLCSYIITSFTYLTDLTVKKINGFLVIGKPEIIEIIIYYLFLAMVLLFISKIKRKWLMMASMIIPIFIIVHKPAENSLTMIDVDQGECIVLTTESGNTFMFDCGSLGESEIFKYRVEPYLLANGIDKIDGLFLSHGDSDHINGAEEYLKRKFNSVEFKCIFITEQMNLDESIQKSLIIPARDLGIDVAAIKENDKITFPEGNITCLYPNTDKINSDSNADSMVLSLDICSSKVLFTGDLPSGIENDLSVSDYDILKVAHHGSKNSTSSSFLNRIKPEIGLISCGIDNSYGHPAKEVLDNLKNQGTKYFITAESGRIRVCFSEKGYVVETYLFAN